MRKIEIDQIYLLAPDKRILKPENILFQLPGRSDIPRVELDPPFAWNANPFNDNNWLSQIQMWRPLDGHIISYAATKDEKWLAAPIRVIIDWYGYYQENEAGSYVWADMNVGMRAMKIAWFLALHFSETCGLSEDFIDICDKLRTSHLEFLLQQDKQTLFNHAFIDLHGAMALIQTLPKDESEKLMPIMAKMLERLLGEQFCPDGIHKEHSPLYQKFMARYLERLQNSGWFGDANLELLISRAKKVLNWLYLPDGRLASIGDTDYQPSAKSRKILKRPEGEIFNSSGYVIFRPYKNASLGNESYLFFMCARHSLYHKHSDDLSCYWYENEDILIDPGKFAYGSSPERKYIISTRAHNTLEIDSCDEYSRGRPRRPRKPHTIVEGAKKKDNLFIGRASMFIQEFDVTHRRLIVLNPGRWLFVSDSILSPKIHNYKFHWHMAPGIRIAKSTGNDLFASLLSGRKIYISTHSSQPANARISENELEPQLQGFCSEGYAKLSPAPCVIFSTVSSSWQFAAVFSLNSSALIRRLEIGKYRLETEDRNYQIDAFRVCPEFPL